MRDRFDGNLFDPFLHNDTLLFASELKALKSHPAVINQTDKEAVSLYFKFGYIPMEKTIYHGVKKVFGKVIELNLNLGNLQPKECSGTCQTLMRLRMVIAHIAILCKQLWNLKHS